MEFVKEVSQACERHGPYRARRWVMPGGAAIVSPCPACRDAALQAERDEQDGARQFKFRLDLVNAGVGTRYHESSFENYRVCGEQDSEALAIVRDYADSFSRRQSPNLVMYGKTGTGKTHLACAMTRALLKRGVSVTYLPILTLFSQYQDITSYGGSGSREEFFARMRAPDLLIIDEFGIVTMKDSERIVLHRVIDERYNRHSPLVIIGNMGISEFQTEVGERAFRRVMGEATAVVFEWDRVNVSRDLFA